MVLIRKKKCNLRIFDAFSLFVFSSGMSICYLQEHGYPAYTTQVGWLGYPDGKLRNLCRQFKSQGFTKFKVGFIYTKPSRTNERMNKQKRNARNPAFLGGLGSRTLFLVDPKSYPDNCTSASVIVALHVDHKTPILLHDTTAVVAWLAW